MIINIMIPLDLTCIQSPAIMTNSTLSGIIRHRDNGTCTHFEGLPLYLLKIGPKALDWHPSLIYQGARRHEERQQAGHASFRISSLEHIQKMSKVMLFV